MSLKDRAILPMQMGILVQQNRSFISSSFMVSSYRIGCENSMMAFIYILCNGWLHRPKKAIYNESLEDNLHTGKLYDSMLASET
jgi:hypothetical protein